MTILSHKSEVIFRASYVDLQPPYAYDMKSILGHPMVTFCFPMVVKDEGIFRSSYVDLLVPYACMAPRTPGGHQTARETAR